MGLLDYQIQFGNLVFPDVDGRYEVVSFEPLNSPAIRTSDVDKPLDHGEFPGIDLMKGRNFVLTLEAWNEDAANILRAFVPGQEQTMLFQHPHLGLLKCRCRVRHRVGPRIDVPSILGKQVITIQFHSTDPRWYGIENVLSTSQVITQSSEVLLPNALEAGSAQLNWFEQWYHIADKNNDHGWQDDRPTYIDRYSYLRDEQGTDRENFHIVYEDSDFMPGEINTLNDQGVFYTFPDTTSGTPIFGLQDLASNSTHIFAIYLYGNSPNLNYQLRIINKSSGVFESYYSFETVSPWINQNVQSTLNILGVAANNNNVFVYIDEGAYERIYKLDFTINTTGIARLAYNQSSADLNHNCFRMDLDGDYLWVPNTTDNPDAIRAYNLSDLSRASSEDLPVASGTSIANDTNGFALTTSHYYLTDDVGNKMKAFLRSSGARDTDFDYDVVNLNSLYKGLTFDGDNTFYINWHDISGNIQHYTVQRGLTLDTDYIFWRELNNNVIVKEANVLKFPDPSGSSQVPFGHDRLPDYLVWYNSTDDETWAIGVTDDTVTPFNPTRHANWRRWNLQVDGAPFWVNEDTFYGIGRRNTLFVTNILNIINNGNIPSHYTLRLYGPVTNPSIVLNGRQFLSYNAEIEDGDFLYINSDTREVLLNGRLDMNVYNMLTDPFLIRPIDPGTHTVEVLGSGTTDNTRLELTYRNAWV